MRVHSKDRDLPEQITRGDVARLLVRAFMNAAALVDAAEVLRDRGHYGAARSLAISAREEVGKGFTAGSFLAGQLSTEDFVATLRSHKYKQAEGSIIPVLAGSLMALPQLMQLLRPDATSLPEAMNEMLRRMQEERDNLFSQLAPTFEMLQNVRDIAERGIDEDARQAGIYVTLKSGVTHAELEYPQQISAADAESELSHLALLVAQVRDATQQLPRELWMDDETADRFAVLVERLLRPGMFELASPGNDQQ